MDEKRREKEEKLRARQANQQLLVEYETKARKIRKPIEPQKQSKIEGNIDVVVVEDKELLLALNLYGRRIRLPERFQ